MEHEARRAGCVMSKYIRLKVNNKAVDAHRVAWEMTSGPIPSGFFVDHKDGNGHNNKETNLRLATNSQNLHNSISNSRNTSGHRGVTWSRASQKWQAQIQHNKRQIIIGLFSSIEEAAQAYRNKSLELNGPYSGFARTEQATAQN